jgi:hypothetical protein
MSFNRSQQCEWYVKAPYVIVSSLDVVCVRYGSVKLDHPERVESKRESWGL